MADDPDPDDDDDDATDDEEVTLLSEAFDAFFETAKT